MTLSRMKATYSGLAVLALFLAMPPPYEALSVAISLGALLAVLGVGFWCAARSGIEVFGPVAELPGGGRAAAQSLLIGGLLGVGLLAALRFGIAVLEPRILERLSRDAAVPLGTWAIILFHAPILEELLFRLFLLSLIAWMLSLMRPLRSADGGLGGPGLRCANMVAAIGFAIVHLPAWYQAGDVGPALLAGVLGINLVAGLVMGSIYLKSGLQFAVLAHLAGDVGLHLVGRLLV